jgi:uncharacterized membrane protein YkvA (DUF1232 family)
MPTDPFPKAAFLDVLRRLPAYGRLAWRLGKDPLLSKARRAALIGAAGYLASPIDAIPGVIPVLGQLDDIAVILAALRLALDGLDPERRQAHLAAVGLTDADLATDMRALGATAGWTMRAGVRVSGRVAVAGAKVGGRAAVAGARASARGLSAVARGTGALAGQAGKAAAGGLARRRHGPGPAKTGAEPGT